MWPILPLVPKCQRAAVNSCGGGLFCITRRARPNCADTEAVHSRKIASSRASRFMEARLFHRGSEAILYKAAGQGAIPAPRKGQDAGPARGGPQALADQRTSRRMS